jgi:hypothetical protein
MDDDSKHIIRIGTDIGTFTLTEPIITTEYLEPKNFLLRTEKSPDISAKTICIPTKTKRNFCIFRADGIELEGIQIGIPSCVYSKMVKGLTKDQATDECIKEGKEAFLVISCKPKEFCKL